MKVAIITDTHFGVRGHNPNFYMANRKFFEQQFFPKCIENDVKHIIHMGDLMDTRKSVNVLAIEEMKKAFLEPIIKHNMTMDLIIGNHDIYYKDTNKVNSPNQIINHENIMIHQNVKELSIGGVPLIYVPWVNQENVSEAITIIENSKAKYLFGHLEITGFDMGSGQTCKTGLKPQMFERFDSAFSGHFHKKTSQNNIHYLGSHSQFTWIDYDQPRGFHILDLEKDRLAFIQNKFELFSKLVYNDNGKEYNEILLDFPPNEIKNKYVKLYTSNVENSLYLDQIIEHIENSGCIKLQIVNETSNEKTIEEIEYTDNENTEKILISEAEKYSKDEVTNSMLESYLMNLFNEARVQE